MKAIRVHRAGDAGELVLEEVGRPEPGPGQLLVRVEASGVNFIDVYRRSGLYPVERPYTPGEEGAGVVEAVGDGVDASREGERVAWAMVSGSYAEYALVPAARAVAVPASVTSRQAAALMLQGMTAHYLATSTYPLKPGERCLVHAAAGGVGLLLVQIARMRGATVIGTVGSDAKAELAREAGANHVIVYTREDFAEAVRRITTQAGVHVVYDSVGSTTFDAGLGLLMPRGMMVLFGQSSGPVEPLDPQRLSRRGSLFLTRPTLADYVERRRELESRAGDLFRWVADGSLKVRVGAEYPLSRAADAHRALEARQTTGKTLLIPGE